MSANTSSDVAVSDVAGELAVQEHDPIARVYGQPLEQLPLDLYIPPDALAVMLDAFEGPLDLLLYLIRKANINVLDIPMFEAVGATVSRLIRLSYGPFVLPSNLKRGQVRELSEAEVAKLMGDFGLPVPKITPLRDKNKRR